ncbi:exodeoxyribonuclease VII large subunit [Reichenbachiella agarivorans]|uniref:Exodeoxyribonuclease 7 large subunit n=1 Tax=Reichenbachiella agarivorans TaxID=2979464 RepID=A0ABY6CPM5_9BACT|nr:exodeoxyribonuclease VII large subunit [Reichenbachiella agarivorans]UXP31724.1 exodeoxyribonuclease VII large subunit [Reichenbachiella agarivorans]
MEHHSLSEFNLLVKQTLSNHLAPSYWIVAEIGEMTVVQKGHCYMDLVEKEGNFIKAKQRATIWSYAFSGIQSQFQQIAGVPLKKGMEVLINASLDYHEVYGISLNIRDIDPSFTLGERERRKQETILQLEREGIIDLNKSLILPQVPQRIAIISSETAAGYGDFVNQINQNSYGYQVSLRLFQATMQGDQAVKSIIDSLHRIYELEDEIDLVVIIRGGGAQTDLDCFDSYDLCAHLAQFPLPVVTGIGHERDHTVADLVANVNLKTPTAVAEFIISGLMQFESDVLELFQKIGEIARGKVQQELQLIIESKHRIALKTQHILQKSSFELDRIVQLLNQKPKDIIRSKSQELNALAKLLQAHDPKEVLKKGYSITRINGQSINDQTKARAGDQLETITYDQVLTSTVTETKKTS